MRRILNFVGILMVLFGVILALGSFMTGQPQWLISGIVAAIIGTGLLVLAKHP